jgi:hypothetical protein
LLQQQQQTKVQNAQAKHFMRNQGQKWRRRNEVPLTSLIHQRLL